MTFSGLGVPGWLNQAASTTGPAMAPFDYLVGGPGLAALQQVGATAATMLAQGQPGQIPAIGGPGYYPVPADPVTSAIWGGNANVAAMFGATMANTIVEEERTKPSAKRTAAYGLGTALVKRIATSMLNNGDPGACMLAFQNSIAAWSSLYPAIKTWVGTWCARNLVFSGGLCEVKAVCAQTLDAKGNAQQISVPAPPSGSITSPPAQNITTPVPAPTPAAIAAGVAKTLADSGQSYAQLENNQELTELGLYLNALSQARLMFTLALGIPTNSSDAVLWQALASRGIPPSEAKDWFVGCDLDLDCFRERMNVALGETDTDAKDTRAKAVLIVGVAAAAALAFFTWRGR